MTARKKKSEYGPDDCTDCGGRRNHSIDGELQKRCWQCSDARLAKIEAKNAKVRVRRSGCGGVDEAPEHL